VIVLDASLLIAFFRATDVHHARARAIMETGEPTAASAITVAEFLVGPARTGREAQAQHALQKLRVATVPIAAEDPLGLAVLRTQTGLRLPDCCVLSAAQAVRADTIATFDERLATVARARGLAVA